MEVILLERIEKLGQMGDVVNVKPGYARNYLLPQQKAVSATADNKTQFESQRAQLEADSLDLKKDAEAVAGKMEGAMVSLIRQAGEAGQLYGSVNARDMSDGLTDAGFTVERRQIRLDEPIKSVGLHPVRVALHPEVFVTVTANVARSQDEAEIQERTGVAVMSEEEQLIAEDAAEIADEAPPEIPADEAENSDGSESSEGGEEIDTDDAGETSDASEDEAAGTDETN